MPRNDMPTPSAAINTSHGKTSYVLVTARRADFPDPATPKLSVNPSVPDLNNAALSFTATSVQKTKRRLNVKLVAVNPPGGAVTPLDGVLSITLIDNSGTTPQIVSVADLPVDYIDDPTAP